MGKRYPNHQTPFPKKDGENGESPCKVMFGSFTHREHQDKGEEIFFIIRLPFGENLISQCDLCGLNKLKRGY
ncbi:MAG: hypothetical protein D6748_00290 [Calditrichaeota bacterium]|nr:MAG: hypothetical protein D6748_00290 [Calditrichota bacterium]